jgi:type-F conjugative transfer system pilin assembly protein TrbC
MLKLSYAASLLIGFQLNSDASHIDLSAFQTQNNTEVASFARNLSQELEKKQQSAQTPNWLKTLEDNSQKSLMEQHFKMPHNKDAEFYIFASLKLKQKHLKALIEDAKRFGGAVVIRGLKNGSFQETIGYLNRILEKDSEGVLIDPTLFRKYYVTSVPVFVLADEDHHDIIRGNVTARFALLKMKLRGDLSSQANERLTHGK